jgi:hypothetical protein
VLAPAKIARHAQWLRVAVNHDHRVDAIFMTGPAVIFHRLSGAVRTGGRHCET